MQRKARENDCDKSPLVLYFNFWLDEIVARDF